jgi:translation initiation factor IF-3
VMFRGREMSHRELGQKVLQRIIEDLRDVAVIEAAPRMEGRQMFMIIAPNPRMLQASRDRAKAQAAQAAASAAAGSAPPAPEAAAAPVAPAATGDSAQPSSPQAPVAAASAPGTGGAQ